MADQRDHKDYPYICKCKECGHRFVLTGLETHPAPAPALSEALLKATVQDGCPECGALHLQIFFDFSLDAMTWYDTHVRGGTGTEMSRAVDHD
jgi:Zn finger protein HypA/HybF involved in hydrogenase expression